MILSNIQLGKNVNISPSTHINNVIIEDDVKISKNCTIFGSPEFPLVIKRGAYVGMDTVLIGYHAQLTIGERVSIAAKVMIITDSGPNASELLQEIYPMEKGPVFIGDDSWIGIGAIITANVTLGKMCVVGANGYVKNSFPDRSVIAGTPARLVKTI